MEIGLYFGCLLTVLGLGFAEVDLFAMSLKVSLNDLVNILKNKPIIVNGKTITIHPDLLFNGDIKVLGYKSANDEGERLKMLTMKDLCNFLDKRVDIETFLSLDKRIIEIALLMAVDSFVNEVKNEDDNEDINDKDKPSGKPIDKDLLMEKLSYIANNAISKFLNQESTSMPVGANEEDNIEEKPNSNEVVLSESQNNKSELIIEVRKPVIRTDNERERIKIENKKKIKHIINLQQKKKKISLFTKLYNTLFNHRRQRIDWRSRVCA